MLRKTLITMTAVAAMCASSAAMAAHGGGFGGGHAGGFGGGSSAGGHAGGFSGGPVRGFGGAGIGVARGSGSAFAPRAAAPMVNEHVRGWAGNTVGRSNFAPGHGRDHFHHRFGYGFGGPYYDFGGSYYDSAYGSCWTYDGVQWVYVCSDDQY